MSERLKYVLISFGAILFGIAVCSYLVGMSMAGAFTAIESKAEREKRVAEGLSGSAAIVIEQSSLRTLYAENADARLEPASTTKILTALTVLKRLPVEMEIKVPSAAVGIEGSSIYLKEGETLTVLDLLYGMMLRSGNDAATALALAVSPTVEEFASIMNSDAKECGATSSNFVNPHGLHHDEHYTTAHDLALITAKAFEYRVFKDIVSSKTAAIGEGESRRVIGNKNKLLRLYEGANGVKTGYTKKSGRCLVGSAKKDGMQLISVVLNHGDMWNDTVRMLENAFNEYEMKPVCFAEMNGNPQAKVIEVPVRFDALGEPIPRSFPLKRDGSEKIKILPSA